LTRFALALAAVALLLAGCGSSSISRRTPAVLLPDVGAGYHLAAASGPLSRDTLAVATAVPPEAMSSYLDGVQLRSAGERVWTSSHKGFVTDIVATFASATGAQGLVALAAKALPGAATSPFSPPGVTGARGFVQTSEVAGKTMFCTIALASAGARVFVVTRCTPYPQDTVTVSRLLALQMRRAG
jgi:hypothetical protein